MKAYLTSVGETTTGLVKWQLERLGFEAILLEGKEAWVDKYRRFLELAKAAGENCIRIDADVIPNKHLVEAVNYFVKCPNEWLVQFRTYDLYRNAVGISSPVYYSAEAFKHIDLIQLHPTRPEAEVWRQSSVNYHTFTDNLHIVGVHGFYQDWETVSRAKLNKITRKQLAEYDFELVDKIKEMGL